MEGLLFYLGGTILLLGAIAVVTSRSAVAAACWLILACIGAAGLFAALHAPFLAVLQVLVYAGAIMVLFLFVIMMLEGPVMAAESARRRLSTGLLALVPGAAIGASVMLRLRPLSIEPFTTTPPPGFGQPMHVSRLLLIDYVLAFELAAILLLVAMVGALALARSGRSRPWK